MFSYSPRGMHSTCQKHSGQDSQKRFSQCPMMMQAAVRLAIPDLHCVPPEFDGDRLSSRSSQDEVAHGPQAIPVSRQRHVVLQAARSYIVARIGHWLGGLSNFRRASICAGALQRSLGSAASTHCTGTRLFNSSNQLSTTSIRSPSRVSSAAFGRSRIIRNRWPLGSKSHARPSTAH
jgi:hypothetical protein